MNTISEGTSHNLFHYLLLCALLYIRYRGCPFKLLPDRTGNFFSAPDYQDSESLGELSKGYLRSLIIFI